MFGIVSVEIINYSDHGNVLPRHEELIIKQISLNALVFLFEDKNNDFIFNYT